MAGQTCSSSFQRNFTCLNAVQGHHQPGCTISKALHGGSSCRVCRWRMCLTLRMSECQAWSKPLRCAWASCSRLKIYSLGVLCVQHAGSPVHQCLPGRKQSSTTMSHQLHGHHPALKDFPAKCLESTPSLRLRQLRRHLTSVAPQ